jgi:hypothetical protein
LAGSSLIESSDSEEVTDAGRTSTLCHSDGGGGGGLIGYSHWRLRLELAYYHCVVDRDVREKAEGTTPGNEDLIAREWNYI